MFPGIRSLRLTSLAVLASCMGFAAGAEGDGQAPAVVPYPLTTCAVAGKPLGSMGDPVVFTHGNREIKLCCAGCRRGFNRDPEAIIAAVDAKAAELAAAEAEAAPATPATPATPVIPPATE